MNLCSMALRSASCLSSSVSPSLATSQRSRSLANGQTTASDLLTYLLDPSDASEEDLERAGTLLSRIFDCLPPDDPLLTDLLPTPDDDAVEPDDVSDLSLNEAVVLLGAGLAAGTLASFGLKLFTGGG